MFLLISCQFVYHSVLQIVLKKRKKTRRVRIPERDSIRRKAAVANAQGMRVKTV